MVRPRLPATSDLEPRLCAHCGDPFIRGPRAIYCDYRCARYAATKAWRIRHPDVHKARRRVEHKKAYSKNKPLILKKNNEWRANNPNYMRRYHRNVSYGRPDIENIDMVKDKYRVARSLGFRSGFEVRVAGELKAQGIDAKYESIKVSYEKPAKGHSYAPDFQLPNGIIIETKGRFVTADRQKHLLIKQQHPELDIRFVFGNSRNRINPGSPTTYAMWCQKNGFKYADRSVPKEWLDEARTN